VPFYLTNLSQLIFSLSSLQSSSVSLQNHIFLIFSFSSLKSSSVSLQNHIFLIFSLSSLQSSSASFKISLFLDYTFHFFQNVFTISHFTRYPHYLSKFCYWSSTSYEYGAFDSTPYWTHGMLFFLKKIICPWVFCFTWLEYFMFYFCIKFSRFIGPHSTIGRRKLKRTKFLWIRPHAVTVN